MTLCVSHYITKYEHLCFMVMIKLVYKKTTFFLRQTMVPRFQQFLNNLKKIKDIYNYALDATV